MVLGDGGGVARVEPAEGSGGGQAGGGGRGFHGEDEAMMGDSVTELAGGRAGADGGQVLGRREVPEAGHAGLGGGALAEQDAAAAADKEKDGFDALGRDAAELDGQLGDGAVFERAASGAQRAIGTERAAREYRRWRRAP